MVTTDLLVLAWVAALTSLMWIPYILARIGASGLVPVLTYAADDGKLPDWAARAKRAHSNAIENLAPFAAVVIVASLLGAANGTTALWSVVYLCARVVHYLAYIAGVPYVRTLAFAAGWLSIMVIFLQIVT